MHKIEFGGETMSQVNVRYIVHDVDAAIPFYTDMLGFHVDMHPAPGFASLSRGSLQLLLNRPGAGGAGQALPNDQLPSPGGWNRIQIEVEDLEATVEKLKVAGGRVPQNIVNCNGRKKILFRKLTRHTIQTVLCFLPVLFAVT